jgi:hypothetical protein
MKPRFLLLLLILVIPVSACAPAQTPQLTETSPPISAAPAPTKWLYEDLLLLDPIDAPTPNDPDLFAVYYQSSQDDWAHIRLDILGNNFSNYQIVINIADSTKFSEENEVPNLVLIITNKNGIWHAVATRSNDSTLVKFPILIDEIPETYSIIVSFPEKYLLTEQPMRISITNSSSKVIDSAAVFWNSSPPAKAPLLLAFWDVLPANTPAQLLQRWDGAHTGPYGSRHGLKHLLAAVEKYEVPVALLDLKDPGTLSGLDLIDQNDYIQQLEEQGLLILPETGFTDPSFYTKTEENNKYIANTFGFVTSNFAFGPYFKHNLYDSNYFFANLENKSHILSIEKQQMIPLPYSLWDDNTAQQVLEADRNGLTQKTLQKLLDISLTPDNSDLVILGGSLISSPWADSSIAHTAFQDLSNHPWINVLSLEELPSIKTDQSLVEFPCYDLFCSSDYAAWTINNDKALTISFYLQNNALAASTQTMGTHLLHPTSDINRQQLQANYWSQLGHFAQDALWAETPLLYDSSCDTDIDNDNVPECNFVSANTTATFEIDDASLITAFHLNDADVTQWVGPTSQIVVGMSDPTFWDLDAGTHSDPSVIPGSFILDTTEPLSFEVSELDDEHIHFSSTDGSISKDYRFTDESLTVTIETDQPLCTDLVLALDPQQRFQPGWAENYNIFFQTDNSFCWGAEDGKAVCISWTNDPNVEINTFKDSLESLSQPLDPNKIYPPGHFLPMSLATVTFSTDTDFTIILSNP